MSWNRKFSEHISDVLRFTGYVFLAFDAIFGPGGTYDTVNNLEDDSHDYDPDVFDADFQYSLTQSEQDALTDGIVWTGLDKPVVIAKGQDLIALKIRETAESHGVAVIEDKALAKPLYHAVEVDQIIPHEFYQAVAQIITFLNRKS